MCHLRLLLLRPFRAAAAAAVSFTRAATVSVTSAAAAPTAPHYSTTRPPDSRADVCSCCFVQAASPDSPGWEELKHQGTEAFKKQQFREADRFYSAALDELTQQGRAQERTVLLNNRSAARTRLERYEEAAADARVAARVSPGEPKVLTLY
jgi:hypothetical protein